MALGEVVFVAGSQAFVHRNGVVSKSSGEATVLPGWLHRVSSCTNDVCRIFGEPRQTELRRRALS